MQSLWQTDKGSYVFNPNQNKAPLKRSFQVMIEEGETRTTYYVPSDLKTHFRPGFTCHSSPIFSRIVELLHQPVLNSTDNLNDLWSVSVKILEDCPLKFFLWCTLFSRGSPEEALNFYQNSPNCDALFRLALETDNANSFTLALKTLFHFREDDFKKRENVKVLEVLKRSRQFSNYTIQTDQGPQEVNREVLAFYCPFYPFGKTHSSDVFPSYCALFIEYVFVNSVPNDTMALAYITEMADRLRAELLFPLLDRLWCDQFLGKSMELSSLKELPYHILPKLIFYVTQSNIEAVTEKDDFVRELSMDARRHGMKLMFPFLRKFTVINWTEGDREAYTHLTTMTSLTSLEIFQFPFNTFDPISSLKDLQVLNLKSGLTCEDNALASLQNLTRLTQIHLTCFYLITTAGLSSLNLENLTLLNLSNSLSIDNTINTLLIKMTRLVSLTLNCCEKVTDEGLRELPRLSRLEHLSVTHLKIGFATAARFQLLPYLTELDISHTEITHTSVPSLLECKKLKVVVYNGISDLGKAFDALYSLPYFVEARKSARRVLQF